MRASVVISALLVCLLLSATITAPRARAQKGRGAVCGDGESLTRTGAEFAAWRAAELACERLGGTSRNTQIIFSNCGLLECRATACTDCKIPGVTTAELSASGELGKGLLSVWSTGYGRGFDYFGASNRNAPEPYKNPRLVRGVHAYPGN